MAAPVSDLDALLRDLRPVLQSGVFVFCVLPPDVPPEAVPHLGLFREEEGVSVIVSEETAARHGWPALFRAAWITLTVRSDLHAVGLTAAVASALAEAGISCNVVAAAHHDHLFVPADRGEEAVAVLFGLSRRRSPGFP
jgi:uncharacterized protein